MSEYDIAIKIAGQLDHSFGATLKSAQSGLTSFGTVGKIAGKVVKATAATIAAAGTAVAAIGAASINVGKNFESAMSSAAATAGATKEEYKKMEAAAMENGRTTSKTATESANALEYMALAGWDVDTSIKALPSVLKLSEASGMDLAHCSDLVTNSLAATGGTVDQLSGFLDVATRAQNKSNTTAEQLLEAYLGVGGTMKNLKVDTRDTATVLGMLANRGIKGSEAGTALNAVMINLKTGTGQAGKMMDKLGISAFNSDGSFKGVKKTLETVNNATKNMTDEQRNAALAAIGGKHHLDALNDMLAGLNKTNADGVSEWDALSKELYNCNGALDQMRNLKLDNLEGDVWILKSALEDAGIKIYKNLNTPLRRSAQAGTQAIYQISDALQKGGFKGMLGAIGDVLAQGTAEASKYAPKAVEAGVEMVDSFLTGIEKNSDQIGSGTADIITALANGIIKIAPRLMVVGAKLIVAIAKGVVQNLPELEAAAKESIKYLLTAMKNALGDYKDFLSSDTTPVFEKVIALLPVVLGGFLAFKQVAGAVKGIKSFAGTLKGITKGSKAVKAGLAGTGTGMSTFAANVMGIGVGIGAAAAGMWLLATAAIAISREGSGAAIAMTLMAGGIIAMMAVAGAVGPKLQASSTGLIAFGGAILMTAGAMALMSFAAIQISNAGTPAIVALAIMAGGITAMLAVAGAMGPQLTAGASGLLSFGGALLMASGAMAIMAQIAIQIASAGPAAQIAMAVMAGGMTAIMVVAAVLGPQLTVAAVGLLAFGAALLMISGAMAVMVMTAQTLASAGTGTQVALAVMAVGVIGLGVAAGALAPLLIAGGVALGIFGAALVIVSTAAAIGSAALLIMSVALPGITSYGAAGAIAITELGAALTVFSAGAGLAGIGSTAAAAGMALLAAASVAADVGFAPLSAEMAIVSASTAVIAATAKIAADGITSMSVGSVKTAAGMGVISAAAAALAVAMTPLAATSAAAAASLLLMTTESLALAAEMAVIAVSLTVFRTNLSAINAAAPTTQMMFARLTVASGPLARSLAALAVPAAALTTEIVVLAAELAKSEVSMLALNVSSGVLVGEFGLMGMTAIACGSSVQLMAAGIERDMTTMQQSMIVFVGTVRSSGMQIIMIAQMTAAGIRASIASVNLTYSGRMLMEGLIRGMEEKRARVMETARGIAASAAASINGALKIHSPSGVTEKSGEYTDIGFANGMQNRQQEVKSAAIASMAAPVMEAGQAMRTIETPQVETRSAVIGETVANLSGNGGTAKTNAQAGDSTPTFVFSPVYHFEGKSPDKEEIVQANRMSEAEFEQMMRSYMRKNKRTSFA